MAEFDRGLLEATGRPRPRVVVLPTAAAPDGEHTFRVWAEMGVEHFSALGAEVEPVLVRNAEQGHDAAALQAIGEADLVYLSGGHPRHLLGVLRDSPLGAAIRAANDRGAVIAGCSAGAMAIVSRTVDFRFLPRVRMPMPFPVRWPEGLSLVDGVAVLPHYDAWPEPFSAFVALQAPKGGVILGIRRGHGGGRLQQRLAGPRTGPGHGLAGPPPRAIPTWRGVPDRRPRRRRRLAQLMAGCARPPAPLAQARTCRCPRRTGGIDSRDQVRGPVGPRGSVRADLPEAVGAVDGLVHARLERHLRWFRTTCRSRRSTRAAYGRRSARSPAGRRYRACRHRRRASNADRRGTRHSAWGPM